MNSEDKIIEYLIGDMPEEEKSSFELAIETDPALQKVLEEYRIVFGTIDADELEKPSMALSHRFNESLMSLATKSNVKTLNTSIFKYVGIAASIVILIGAGILFGIQYNQGSLIRSQAKELVSLRNNVENMLDDQSVPNRVNAIYVAQESNSVDPLLVDILVKTLREDESSHVRLAAVQALSDYTTSQIARVALIEQLKNENDPFVKVAIIQSLSKLKESNAVHTFDNLIENEETPRFIKDEAHKAKLLLDKI